MRQDSASTEIRRLKNNGMSETEAAVQVIMAKQGRDNFKLVVGVVLALVIPVAGYIYMQGRSSNTLDNVSESVRNLATEQRQSGLIMVRIETEVGNLRGDVNELKTRTSKMEERVGSVEQEVRNNGRRNR